MKFENVRIYNFEHALRGMRNPKNSWDKSDSLYGIGTPEEYVAARNEMVERWLVHMPFEKDTPEAATVAENITQALDRNGLVAFGATGSCVEWALIGPEDMRLAKQLIKGGSEHRKFLRQILVTVDITAPLYWQNSFCQ